MLALPCYCPSFLKGYMSGIRLFTRIRPEKNEQRWYAIAWGPTLFGAWGVHLSWGRLGTNQYQQRVLGFFSEREAASEAQAQVERRLKRGYIEVPTV